MKLFNLSPKIKKAKKPVKKEDLNQDIAKIKNLTKDIKIDKANVIWASDFTYLKYFSNKFIYLATIIDYFTREIIG
jgi:transposase InsO family protein